MEVYLLDKCIINEELIVQKKIRQRNRDYKKYSFLSVQSLLLIYRKVKIRLLQLARQNNFHNLFIFA